MEDAARDELELELAMLGDDGVPGVVAALGSDHHVGLLGEEVDELALALVSPLSTDDDYDHGDDPTTVDSGGWAGVRRKGLPQEGKGGSVACPAVSWVASADDPLGRHRQGSTFDHHCDHGRLLNRVLVTPVPFPTNGHLRLSVGPPRTVFGDLGRRRAPSPDVRP